jgi:hypothetical protein
VKNLVTLFLLLAFLSAPLAAARAQDAGEVAVPEGTELTAATTEALSSKTSTEGDSVTLKVVEDVRVNGQVVIAKGALVKGVIVKAKKAGMMGRGGQLQLRVESTTTADGQSVKLRSSKGKSGDDKTGATIALVVLFGPVGLLKHGKQAEIKPGTEIKVYTDEAKQVKVSQQPAS